MRGERHTVRGDRLTRILTALSSHDGVVEAWRLCAVAAETAQVTGAGIMLIAGDLPQGSVCTSDAVSSVIEELQYTTGEGPCVDAHMLDRPVVEADLDTNGPRRWPVFAAGALDAGARAVFGFPLAIGAVRMGALNLYRDRPGALSDDQHADALVVADVAARSVLAMQASAPPGTLAEELGSGADFRLVVHQAAGMVAVQLGVRVSEALVRLRASAFASGRPLQMVARDVVTRVVRFEPEDLGQTDGC